MTDAVRMDSIAYRIYRSARLLRRNLLAFGATRGIDLTPEQWFVLNKLSWRDGQSQVSLGDDFFADRANMTRILATLEKRGLVRREPDPDDGRRMRVFLTEEGRDVHDRFAADLPAERARLFEGMSEADIAAAQRVLDQLERNVLAAE